ncbi:MAG: type II secretion system protein [Campylobacterota bacterium]|nr:type II secretion system protein [Campylobacterota bacterium]
MKKAFSMIELVFAIVVIGILAATILPSTKTNPLQEAAIQLQSHIRYTQHLAIVDDKYNALRIDTAGDLIWFKDRWQLVFSSSSYTGGSDVWAYTIFSDRTGNAVTRGDAQESEVAKNPENSNQIMTGGYSATAALDYTNDDFKGMKKLNLGKSYGVTSIELTGGCPSSDGYRIVFDSLGRPLKGDMSGNNTAYESDNLIQTNCDITLSDGSENVVLRIRPETGYVCILNSSSVCI